MRLFLNVWHMSIKIGDVFTIKKSRPSIKQGTYTVIDIYTTRNEAGEKIRKTALVCFQEFSEHINRVSSSKYLKFEVPLSTVALNKNI